MKVISIKNQRAWRHPDYSESYRVGPVDVQMIIKEELPEFQEVNGVRFSSLTYILNEKVKLIDELYSISQNSSSVSDKRKEIGKHLDDMTRTIIKFNSMSINFIIKYIFSNYTNFELKKSHLYVITFTGGLGAQIISSAIYFYLKKKNIPVVANLSYFKNKEISNKANSYSIWNWELDSFNIFMNDFDENFPKNSTRIIKVNDGLLKIKLFLEALKIVKIRLTILT